MSQQLPGPAPETGSVVVIGGTAGLGRDLAQHYADRGRRVVVAGRDSERAAKVAAEAAVLLLENRSVNGANLDINGGMVMT